MNTHELRSECSVCGSAIGLQYCRSCGDTRCRFHTFCCNDDSQRVVLGTVFDGGEKFSSVKFPCTSAELSAALGGGIKPEHVVGIHNVQVGGPETSTGRLSLMPGEHYVPDALEVVNHRKHLPSTKWCHSDCAHPNDASDCASFGCREAGTCKRHLRYTEAMKLVATNPVASARPAAPTVIRYCENAPPRRLVESCRVTLDALHAGKPVVVPLVYSHHMAWEYQRHLDYATARPGQPIHTVMHESVLAEKLDEYGGHRMVDDQKRWVRCQLCGGFIREKLVVL